MDACGMYLHYCRGYCLDNEQWVYGFFESNEFVISGDNTGIRSFIRTVGGILYEVNPETVGVATGRFAKESRRGVFDVDKLIFVGDKLEILNWHCKTERIIKVVEWMPEHCAFNLGSWDYKILGNIHDEKRLREELEQYA